MGKLKPIALVVIVLLSLSVKVYSQSTYSYKKWGTEDGLPQSSILSICNANDGKLYLGTWEGLVSYDGFKLKNIALKKLFNTNQLQVLEIHQDKRENFWIMTPKVLYMVNKEFDKILKSYSIQTTEQYSKIIESKTYGLAFLIDAKIYKAEKDSLVHISGVGSTPYNDILYGNDSTLFLSNKSGTQKINMKSSEISSITDITTFKLFKITDETIAYVDSLNSITIYNFYTQQKTLIHIPEKTHTITSLCKFADNELIVCTDKRIHNYNLIDKKFTQISSSAIGNISGINLLSLNNTIWVGATNGLVKITPQKFKSVAIPANYSSTQVSAIYWSAFRKKIIVGSSCGDLLMYDVQKNTYEEIKLNDQLKPICIWSVAEDNANNIWVAEYNSGIHIIDNQNRYLKWINEKNGLSSNLVKILYSDSKKRMWIINESDVEYFDPTKQKIVKAEFGEKIKYSKIIESATGELFFILNKKLYTWDNDKLIPLKLQKGAEYNCFTYDNTGRLWLMGDNHLYVLDRNTMYKIDKNKLCLPNSIIEIFAAKNNTLWLTSSIGIFNFQIKELEKLISEEVEGLLPNYYNKTDGILSPEFNSNFSPMIISDGDNNIWLSTLNNMVKLYADNYYSYNLTQKLSIDSICVNGKKIDSSEKRIKIDKEELISVYYSNPNISSQQSIPVLYKIDQKNTAWKLHQHPEKLDITLSESGSFVLQIKPLLGEKEIEFNYLIVVKPPFYLQLNFVLPIAILTVLFTIIAFMIRIKGVRKHEKSISTYNTRIEQMRLLAIQSQMNPHFIFNCLNSIQHFIVINDVDNANKYLTLFSKLLRNYLNSADNNFVSMETELDMIELYVSLEKLRFQNGFNFEIQVDPKIDSLITDIPTMLIQPLVENAIHHGLFHLKNKEGKLALHFIKNGNDLVIKITDNGVGFSVSAQINSKKTGYHESKGIQLIQERLEILEKIYQYKISLTFENLNTGTEAKLIIHSIYANN